MILQTVCAFFRQKIGNSWPFLGENCFFFVLAALQPPICCSNTTANTFQWVRPRPRRSSMILQNSRAFFRQTIGNFWPLLGELIFFCAGGPATPDMLLQYNCKHVSVGPSPTPAVVNDPTKVSCILSAKNWQFLAIVGRKLIFFSALAALQPPIYCSNTTANTFQSVRPRPRRSSMILQTVRAFFRQKIGNFWPLLGELIFFCAGGPATPDMLLQYNCKHVSVGPSPTPAVVYDPTNRSCILSAKSWQFMTIFGRKLIFFLRWRPCNPRYVAPIQLQTRFSGSVPDPGGCQ